MKRAFLPILGLLLGFMVIGSAGGALGAEKADAEKLKRLSIFLSNFTELGFMDFETKDFSADNSPDLIRFGVWHNYVNNYKSRISQCKIKDCQWGALTIDGRQVAESVKKYFGLDVKLISVTESDPPYYYDGKRYHFAGADGEAVYYARVAEVFEEPGQIRLTGELYNAEDETDKLGRFEALARPYQYGGQDRWAILSFKTEYYE